MTEGTGRYMAWPATTRYGLSVAPGNLGLVQDFLNTITEGTIAPPDLLATLDSAQEWADQVTEQWISIDELGWAKTLPRLTENDRKALAAFRDRLFEGLFGHSHSETASRAGRNNLTYRPVLTVSTEGIGLRPDGEGWKYFETALLLICHQGQIEGVLRRMKSCKSDTCDVVFYDRSNNNSAVWHDVKVCGNRANVRAYRERAASH
ncbi:CGNR zinc finger domain-containing protein [Arthrobacter sp. NPDC080073]|uniref:CGNR zinc finger domain-containing protein n=1 Tax=Arthrobacter sp. NPDC080073 TaxID=3155919 RepID=UPI00342F1D01